MSLYFINYMYMICSLPSREMFTSKANQHVLDRVAREVKSLQPETLSSLIKGMFMLLV